MGFLLAQERNWDEAAAALDEAVRLGAGPEAKDLLDQVRAMSFLDEGNRLFDAGRYSEAVAAYDRSLDIRKDTAALVNKANALIAAGEPEKAAQILKSAPTEKSLSIPALETLALAYAKSGRPEEAEKVRQAVEAAGKNDRTVWMRSGEFHLLNRAWTNADKSLQRAYELCSADTERAEVRALQAKVWTSAGNEAWNARSYTEAQARYERALSFDSNDSAARAGLTRAIAARDTGRVRVLTSEAQEFVRKGDFASAAERFRQALEIREDMNEVRYNLAQCYYQTRNYPLAELQIREYLSAVPDDPDGVSLLASILGETGRQAESRQILQKAIAGGKENGQFHYLLGLAMERDGQKRDAAARFRRAIELDPSLLDARISLGNLHYAEKEYSKAQEQYEEVLKRDPRNDVALYNLGFIYLKKNRWNEALAMFKKAEAIIPDYPPLHFSLARCYYYTGDYEMALKYGAMAQETAGTDPIPTRWGLANIYVKLYLKEQDPKKREEWRKQAASLCESCIASEDHPDISIQARSRIVIVVPDGKYLFKAKYDSDRKFTPRIVENTLYSWSDRDNGFIKVFKETGERIWKSGRMPGRPVLQYEVNRDLYAALESGDVVCLDGSTGKEKFRVKTAVAGLYPCADGVLLLQKDGALAFYKSSKKEWSVPTMSPALGVFTSENTIFVRFADRLSAYDAASGGTKWEWSVPAGTTVVSVAAIKDTVFVERTVNAKTELAALAASSGEQRWVAELKSGLRTAPVGSFESAACLLQDNSVVCFGRDGKKMWSKNFGETVTSMELQNGMVFVAQKDGLLIGLNPADGKEVWKFTLNKDALASEGLFTVYYLEK
jgi:tetratricopeptide (TPR) repeat protein/outer membrane protein assembly factor BamB